MRHLPLSPSRLWTTALALAAAAPAALSQQTLSFQRGVNGYDGAVDTSISEAAPDSHAFANSSVLKFGRAADSKDGGAWQTLIRFDQIIGDGDGLIPEDAEVVEATLTLYQPYGHSGKNQIARMLVPWDNRATWSRFGADGVQLDDQESSAVVDDADVRFVKEQPVRFKVTESVQAYLAGAPNHGWVLTSIDTGKFNSAFPYSSEYEDDTSLRPALTVRLRVPDASSVAEPE